MCVFFYMYLTPNYYTSEEATNKQEENQSIQEENQSIQAEIEHRELKNSYAKFFKVSSGI